MARESFEKVYKLEIQYVDSNQEKFRNSILDGPILLRSYILERRSNILMEEKKHPGIYWPQSKKEKFYFLQKNRISRWREEVERFEMLLEEYEMKSYNFGLEHNGILGLPVKYIQPLESSLNSRLQKVQLRLSGSYTKNLVDTLLPHQQLKCNEVKGNLFWGSNVSAINTIGNFEFPPNFPINPIVCKVIMEPWGQDSFFRMVDYTEYIDSSIFQRAEQPVESSCILTEDELFASILQGLGNVQVYCSVKASGVLHTSASSDCVVFCAKFVAHTLTQGNKWMPISNDAMYVTKQIAKRRQQIPILVRQSFLSLKAVLATNLVSLRHVLLLVDVSDPNYWSWFDTNPDSVQTELLPSGKCIATNVRSYDEEILLNSIVFWAVMLYPCLSNIPANHVAYNSLHEVAEDYRLQHNELVYELVTKYVANQHSQHIECIPSMDVTQPRVKTCLYKPNGGFSIPFRVIKGYDHSESSLLYTDGTKSPPLSKAELFEIVFRISSINNIYLSDDSIDSLLNCMFRPREMDDPSSALQMMSSPLSPGGKMKRKRYVGIYEPLDFSLDASGFASELAANILHCAACCIITDMRLRSNSSVSVHNTILNSFGKGNPNVATGEPKSGTASRLPSVGTTNSANASGNNSSNNSRPSSQGQSKPSSSSGRRRQGTKVMRSLLGKVLQVNTNDDDDGIAVASKDVRTQAVLQQFSRFIDPELDFKLYNSMNMLSIFAVALLDKVLANLPFTSMESRSFVSAVNSYEFVKALEENICACLRYATAAVSCGYVTYDIFEIMLSCNALANLLIDSFAIQSSWLQFLAAMATVLITDYEARIDYEHVDKTIKSNIQNFDHSMIKTASNEAVKGKEIHEKLRFKQLCPWIRDNNFETVPPQQADDYVPWDVFEEMNEPGDYPAERVPLNQMPPCCGEVKQSDSKLEIIQFLGSIRMLSSIVEVIHHHKLSSSILYFGTLVLRLLLRKPFVTSLKTLELFLSPSGAELYAEEGKEAQTKEEKTSTLYRAIAFALDTHIQSPIVIEQSLLFVYHLSMFSRTVHHVLKELSADNSIQKIKAMCTNNNDYYLIALCDMCLDYLGGDADD